MPPKTFSLTTKKKKYGSPSCRPHLYLQVLATDGSKEQLAHATPAPNVTYEQSDAHSIPLPDGSADLITVASALHWFELPRFYRECRRALKPHGCLAAWAIPLVRLAVAGWLLWQW